VSAYDNWYDAKKSPASSGDFFFVVLKLSCIYYQFVLARCQGITKENDHGKFRKA